VGRSTRIGQHVLSVLPACRPRYARIAELAGYRAKFAATDEFEVVEQLDGTGMTDFYGASGRAATPEYDPISDAECERKIALLQASWCTVDDFAAHVSPVLCEGPRGGGRERDHIIRHVNGAEIYEYASKIGVKDPGDEGRLRGHARLPGCRRRGNP
jgi:hypothetical protein